MRFAEGHLSPVLKLRTIGRGLGVSALDAFIVVIDFF